MTANLRIADEKRIIGRLTMYIKDNSSDCTEGNGVWDVFLYTAPVGYKIIEILNPASCDLWYYDDDMIEQWHKEYCGLGIFDILAETVNDDLCDASLDDRTRMRFYCDPIRIVLERRLN